jgi:hypothetical protein
MPVSFSKDVTPMFRKVDIDHMKVHGVHLDDCLSMANYKLGPESGVG